jgi:transcriptional regulator with XRE-family HTH domain
MEALKTYRDIEAGNFIENSIIEGKKDFAKKIVGLRYLLNLSQKELADRLGTSQKNISDWECGRIPVDKSIEMVLAFCEEQGVDFNSCAKVKKITGEEMTKFREDTGMTKKELSSELGISPTTLRGLEQGRSRIASKTRAFAEFKLKRNEEVSRKLQRLATEFGFTTAVLAREIQQIAEEDGEFCSMTTKELNKILKGATPSNEQATAITHMHDLFARI